MPKLIAVEWDGREARVAVANPRGNEVVVEQAFSIPLEATSADETPSTEDIGRQLAVEFSSRGLTGSDSLIGLARSNVELRLLSLPVTPPEEVPDMVRFQAMQAFTAIGEDWPLDFVEIDRHDDSVSVLAAVVSPKLVAQVQAACAASELKTKCLVLRPFAAVSLLHRCDDVDAYRNSLIVDVLADGADLTAVANGKVVFMRSVRLPALDDPKVQARALVGELRRTIGAAQNQMGGSTIEQIVICGSGTEHEVLERAISEALSLDVVTTDPFDAVRVGRGLKKNLPEHSGRYAPLLGMLADEAAGTGQPIDFLNPRKRPDPPSNARRNILAAVTTIAIVGALTFLGWSKLRQMDDDIAALELESTTMDQAVDAARELTAKADAVKEFTDGDITWLDEIREVARRLPDADNVILDDVSIGAHQKRGGVMTLKGNVKSSDVIEHFEDVLRYGENTVLGRYGTIDQKYPDYPYTLDTSVIVPPDVQEAGHSRGRPKLETEQQSGDDEQQQQQDAAPGPQDKELQPAKEGGGNADAKEELEQSTTPKSKAGSETDGTPAAADDAKSESSEDEIS